MTYRKNQRVHSSALIGDLPVGWYMVLRVFESLEILSLLNERNGLTYMATWKVM